MNAADLPLIFCIIFAGAAAVATFALYTRQPLLIAYIAIGALVGPFGAGWVTNTELLSGISHIGIIFLLFLLGLDMQPKALLASVSKTTSVALISSALFALSGYGIAAGFGFNQSESIIIGLAMMFSSTIIGIKLLPTTVLHHRHMGELMVALLLLQDVIAILVLIGLMTASTGSFDLLSLAKPMLALPLITAFAFAAVRWVLLPLITRFDRFHEYIFLLAVGWCLGLAELAVLCGLSAEVGAFLGGISLATSPIAQFIAERLKPLRDFFLVMFFFSLGAQFDWGIIGEILWATLALSLAMLALKPVIFRFLLQRFSERSDLAWDVGFRLGQISEFSLLIAFLAEDSTLIGKAASQLIQATAIVTFLLSSYIVMLNYPTPIAISDRLRRD